MLLYTMIKEREDRGPGFPSHLCIFFFDALLCRRSLVPPWSQRTKHRFCTEKVTVENVLDRVGSALLVGMSSRTLSRFYGVVTVVFFG